MIAQKMMDAKHSEEPRHTPIAQSDLVAAASGTSSSEHPWLYPFSIGKVLFGRHASLPVPGRDGNGASQLCR